MDEKYEKYLKNKRVCIVGPAPHLIGQTQGDFINDFDIIVRLNRSIPLPPNRYKDLGNRTDIFYNCLNPHPENGGKIDYDYVRNNIKWLSSPYPKIFPFDRDIIRVRPIIEEKNINFHVIDENYYKKLDSEMGCRPNTGTLAILDLLRFPIKELYVMGITFFKNGYDTEYRNSIDGIKVKDQEHSEFLVKKRMEHGGNHKIQPQIDYIKNVYNIYNEFVGDEEFKKAIGKK